MEKRILLASPHMGGNEQKYIDEAFKTNWIAPLGPNVDQFEKNIADYINLKAAAALSSGTAAIDLALRLLDVGIGDIVFCSSLTFIASANPIVYRGATPVFIDSEWDTWNMSPEALEQALKEAKLNGQLPKAVIIVNLYGQSAKMDELVNICDSFSVPIVEDAAESLGSMYKGKKSGTFGKYGIYSFNGNKIITTSGGGMLVSNDVDGIKQARFLATQARDQAKHYQHSLIGYNYRMSNVLAGIGRGQLEVIDKRIKKKREIYNQYFEKLSKVQGVSFMPEMNETFSNRWLSVILLDPEKINVSPYKVIDLLNDENIEARPVWKPLHMQPVFRGSKLYSHCEKEIVSETLFARGVCLPSDTNMTREQQDRVIKVLLEAIDN